MKSLLDLSIWPLEWIIPTMVLTVVILFILKRIVQIQKKHIATKKLNWRKILNLMFTRNRKITWEDFQQAKGSFSDNDRLSESYGGGVSGSW